MYQLFINKKNTRHFTNIGQCFFPRRQRVCFDVLVGSGDVGCDAEFGVRLQGAAQVFDELFVAVWCFDENLRLMFGINAFLDRKSVV